MAGGFASDDKVPLTGGTMTGTLTLDGSPPLRIPAGAEAGYSAVSDASGNVTWSLPGLLAAQTLASNGAVTISASNGNVQAVTLAANASSSAITGAVTGREITIQWIQDGTGSRTYVWPPNCKFAGGAAPSASTTAGWTDSVTFIFNGTNWLEKARATAIR